MVGLARRCGEATDGVGTVVLTVGFDAEAPFTRGFGANGDLRAGMRAAAEFLSREAGLVPGVNTNKRGSGPHRLCTVSRRHLRLVAMTCLGTEVRFNSMLFDSDISRASVEGDSLHQRILWLMDFFQMDGRLAELVDWLIMESGPCVSRQLDRLLTPSDGQGEGAT